MAPKGKQSAGLRGALEKNQTTTATVCFVLLALAIGVIAWTYMAGAAAPQVNDGVYYYDLNTGEVFTAAYDPAPPIVAPSGPRANGAKAGVRAHIFTCDSCEVDMWIGYLSANRPMKPEEKARVDGGVAIGSTTIIGTDDASVWYAEDSPDAIKLINVQPCEGDQVRIDCLPGQ